MHSIHDIKFFYENLTRDPNFTKTTYTETSLESRFNELFRGYDSNSIERIFPIAQKNSLIKEVQEELTRVEFDAVKRDELEKKLRKLKKELLELNTISQFKKFFIEIVLKPTYMTDLIVFENCLIGFKKDKLKGLRKERIKAQEEFLELDALLKRQQSNLERNKTNQLENEIIKMNTKKKLLTIKIKELDNQIDVLDLTVDKFWDEVFSTYDWINEKKKSSSPISDPTLKADVEKFNSQIDTLLNRYIRLLKYGIAVHILRGKPLQVESKEFLFSNAAKEELSKSEFKEAEIGNCFIIVINYVIIIDVYQCRPIRQQDSV